MYDINIIYLGFLLFFTLLTEYAKSVRFLLLLQSQMYEKILTDKTIYKKFYINHLHLFLRLLRKNNEVLQL